MKKLDLKIKSLCDKLEYIVKYGNELTINKRSDYWGDIYTVYSNNLYGDIFSISFISGKFAYAIKVEYDSSDDLGILIDEDNENAKKLMGLVKDKYENQKDEEKIEKIDKSLEIIDRINDKIFKED